MNEKLTREEAIKLHKQMWKDMQDKLGDDPRYSTRLEFKEKWVREHLPGEHIQSNCFLCEYAKRLEESKRSIAICKCDFCPIAWNSTIRPICNPGICAFRKRKEVDYRFSPISVILALPEREV